MKMKKTLFSALLACCLFFNCQHLSNNRSQHMVGFADQTIHSFLNIFTCCGIAIDCLSCSCPKIPERFARQTKAYAVSNDMLYRSCDYKTKDRARLCCCSIFWGCIACIGGYCCCPVKEKKNWDRTASDNLILDKSNQFDFYCGLCCIYCCGFPHPEPLKGGLPNPKRKSRPKRKPRHQVREEDSENDSYDNLLYTKDGTEYGPDSDPNND